MSWISGQDIMTYIYTICSFGNRWMNSTGEERTRDFLYDEFRKFGLETELQPFPYLLYEPKRAYLNIDDQEVDCEPLALSNPGRHTVSGQIEYCGQCTHKDMNKFRERGEIAENSIVISDNLRSFEAYPNAEEAGAVGFILATNLDDNTIRCGSARFDQKEGTIPGVSIGGQDAGKLIRKLENKQNVAGYMSIDSTIRAEEGKNVIARLPGETNERIVISAHYDSFWNGVHAMDNGAGISSILALAQKIQGKGKLPYTIEFVCFGGEELGLWGSTGYCKQSKDLSTNVKAIINLDTFGSNKSLLEIGATSDILNLCEESAETLGYQVDCWNSPPRSASDQDVFVRNGVSAIWFANCGSDPRYHTCLDQPSEMDQKKLEKVANLALHITDRLNSGK